MDERADEIIRQRISQRLIQENAASSAAPLGQDELQKRLDDWILLHAHEFEIEKAQIAQRLKARLTYTAADDKEYIYLGDYDSYVWLRNARNYLRTGTTCDTNDDGKCLDTYSLAPVGGEMQYNRSLHIVAIVGIHRFITFFSPDYPLSASAFLAPVVVGVLGVVPAFFLGCSLGGSIGGLFAALLSALYHQFLVRSMGSDNDVWNVVLPLFLCWALCAALSARSIRRQVLYSVLAGGVCGLHASTWPGWRFFFLTFLVGLLGSGVLSSLRHVFQVRWLTVWQAQEVRKISLAFGIFLLSASICTALVGVRSAFLEIFSMGSFFVPDQNAATVTSLPQNEPALSAGDLETLWPDNFSTVTELLRPDLAVIVDSFWGGLLFCGSLGGILLLFFPKDGWCWRHWGVFILGASVFVSLILMNPTDPQLTLMIGALPFLSAGLNSCFDTDSRRNVPLGVATIIAGWFFGAWFLSYQGIRFLLLLAPPFAYGCASSAGWLLALTRQFMRRVSPQFGWRADPFMFACLMYFLIDPLQGALIVARGYVPSMEDAWWDTFTKIREESPAEAILNTWWDYGYWAKYVAERRVSNDGGSLRTHVPYWLGKALVTPDEKESIGVLRMLNCGSDALPYPEGQRGAYAQILATGVDAITAHHMLTELVRLDRAAAQMYLTEKGVASDRQGAILLATHCSPPDSYLVVASEQLLKPNSWARLGAWDFRRAYIVNKSRFLPQADAVTDLSARFGFTVDEATRLYSEVQNLSSREQERDFISPFVGRLSLSWIPCQAQIRSSMWTCPIHMAMNRQGSLLQTFSYDPEEPEKSLFHLRLSESEGAESQSEGPPGIVMWADGRSLHRLTPPSPLVPSLGVMVDVANQRLLIGPVLLVQSMFVQLLYLDERYAEHFEKFDERGTRQGTRVVTWRIRWEGKSDAATPPGALRNLPPLPEPHVE